MSEKHWIKWFPQDWIADPNLTMCSLSAQGLWANALNLMFLLGSDRVSGSVETVSRLCRCRSDEEFNAHLSELKDAKVCDVEMQNGCTIIICRRIARALRTSQLRSRAAASRWCKHDANHSQAADAKDSKESVQRSAYAYAYAYKEGGVGEENPRVVTLEMAVEWCARNGSGYTADQVREQWLYYDAMRGPDGGWLRPTKAGAMVPISDWRSELASALARFSTVRRPAQSVWEQKQEVDGLRLQVARHPANPNGSGYIAELVTDAERADFERKTKALREMERGPA